MRVLWVNEAADFVGGCEQYIFNTAHLLREQGIRSTLLYECRQDRFSARFVVPFDQAFPIVDVKTQVAEICPDVIYVHRVSGLRAIEELREAGVPVVRFFHDYKPFCLREHKYKPIRLRTCNQAIGWRCYPCLGFINRTHTFPGIHLRRLGPFWSEIRVNQQLDAIATGSQHMVDHLIAHGFDPQKTHRLYYYSLPPGPHKPVRQEDDLLLFAGQLHTGKGLDVLLKAMTLTRAPARLVIVGTGPQAEHLKQLSQSLGLGGRVSFEGWLPSSDLWRHYLRATCAVVPSRFPEPFCMVGTEAMSYARPVIGTAVGAIPEWLEDRVTGILVPPNDSNALAHAIDHIVENPQQAAEMGKTGGERYHERFAPDKHISTLLALFETLVTKGSARE